MTSSHLINRLSSRILNLQSPIEILETFYPFVRLKTGLAVKPFGCIAYVYNPLHRLNKWSSKSLKCVFLGYSPTQKGYKLYHLVTRKYIVSKDVVFDEKVFYYMSTRHESLRDLDYLRKLDDLVPQVAEFDSDPIDPAQDSDLSPELVGLPSPVTEPDSASIDSSQVQLPERDLPESQGIPSEHPPTQDPCLSGPSSPVSKSPSNSIHSPVPSVNKSPPNPNQGDWSIALRKGKRSCVKPRPHNLAHYLTFHKVSPEYKTFLLHLHESFIPNSPREALQIPQWKKAMDEEMKALLLNYTWEIVPLPKGKRTVDYCWVFTLKCTQNAGNKPKARLVAKGFTQTYGIDYQETFAPIAKMNTIRILISLVVHFDWPLCQYDIKNAFLHGDLKEEIYMNISLGYRNDQNSGQVCQLKKALYGLKQSPRAWFGKFTTAMKEIGYKQCNGEHTLFFQHTSPLLLTLLVVYVDDIIITGSNLDEINRLENHLGQVFHVK